MILPAVVKIVRFDLARYFRSISTYIYFLLMAAIAFLLTITAGGAFQGASLSVGGGGKVLVNSPFTLTAFISIVSYYGLLIVSAIAGKAAFRDFENQTHSFFFTAPIGKAAYLGGRFLASAVILVAIFSSVAVGVALGTVMPFVDHTLFGPNRLLAYIQPYLVLVIPNLLIVGALFFSMAALTRKILPVYMTSIILLIGYLIAVSISNKIEEKFIAALLDPFGTIALARVTEYWTVSEKNTRLIGMEGALLWNRLLWAGAAGALMAFTYLKFQFVYALEGRRASRKKARAEVEPAAAIVNTAFTGITSAVARDFSTGAQLRAMLRLTRLGFRETVKNIYFAVIVLAGVLFMIAVARTTGGLYGTPTWPVTYQMIELVGGSFALFVLIVITFYSGELVWRERDARTQELVDTLPLPGWVLFLSKLAALFLVVVVLMAVVMATGMGIQLAKGYTHLEPALYLKDLFGLKLIDYWLLCVLAIAVQTLVNNKYMGHFVMVLYYVASTFMGQLGLEHNLYNYGGNPGYTYSDMNKFGHFLPPVFWFDGYWAALAVLLALAAHLFQVRGLATGWRWRWTLARHRFGAPQAWIALGALAAFAALGGFIFYNTNIRNTYRTRKQREMLQARYEKEYRKYRNTPQPRIAAVQLHVDIYPEQRSVRIAGYYDIVNTTAQPVNQVLVSLPEDLTERQLRFTPAAKLQSDERALGVAVYRLDQPLAPGATGRLDFSTAYAPHGFSNQQAATFVVYNGSFLNSQGLPHFGYQDNAELAEDNTRRKYGLPPKERMADLNDIAARRNTYIAGDADWIAFDAVVSTSADQIAVAPGELVREWTEGGRRFFEYRTRKKILDFTSVLSARYSVMRDRWQDIALGVYYNPGHEYDLEKMMKGMQAALAYCSANFSPYQNKTLRIMEFPRYATFAQSFPASIPYSEAIGFIAKVDPRSDTDIDYPFYVTAHEVAHQWWAHQVVGANVQGSTLMSESLAQYTALMVMKHEVGPDRMRRFLKYEMDRYLSGRSLERKKELPLERVENQPYIHYNKASVIFYALQDYAGEDNVNRALHDYLQAVAYQDPPYTNSAELIDRLRKIVPPQYSYIIHDMFETITLYENRALSATYRRTSDGKFEVKLKVAAKKIQAGELGEEKEVPLADWIDIGVLDKDGKPLYMVKHKIERNETEFTIPVDRLPAKAGIDPWNKLVDRKPDDNVIAVTKL